MSDIYKNKNCSIRYKTYLSHTENFQKRMQFVCPASSEYTAHLPLTGHPNPQTLIGKADFLAFYFVYAIGTKVKSHGND